VNYTISCVSSNYSEKAFRSSDTIINMKACIIGGSGRLGNLITDTLLEHNIKIHTVVRTLNKFKFKDKVNKISNGSALDYAVVKDAIDGCDVVFSVLGEKTFWKPFTTLSDAASLQLKVMSELGIRRWVGIGHYLVLDHEEGGLIGDHGIPSIFENIFAEKKREYELLKNSSLDWTLMCPKYMPAGELTKNYVLVEDRLPENADSISVEDVADAMVEIALGNNFIKKRVGIGYKNS
jgi:putative NADH-flavin reductase